MPNANDNQRDTGVTGAATALKLSPETVRRDLRRGAPHDRRNGKIYLDVREYAAWRHEHGLTGERGRPVGGGGAYDHEDREGAALLLDAWPELRDPTYREQLDWYCRSFGEAPLPDADAARARLAASMRERADAMEATR